MACASENSSGALIVVQTLLDADADLTSVNNARNSAFHIACLNGNHQILEFLSAQEIFSEIWELRNSYLQVKSVHFIVREAMVLRIEDVYILFFFTQFEPVWPREPQLGILILAFTTYC